MTTPQRRPTTALLASVPAEVLQATLEHEDTVFVTSVLVRGEGTYHALVNYEPGSPHDERDVEAARELSARCDGPVYMVSFGEDEERITTCLRGAVTADAESDDAPDPDKLARELGLGGMFPPKPPGPRSFMFVENARVTDVATALKLPADHVGGPLHLEPRGVGVFGWSESPLDSRPRTVSRRLGTRVYLSLETAESFAVLVIEKGATAGIFETPRTVFSDGETPVDSILGETTRDGILRAMGAPLDR